MNVQEPITPVIFRILEGEVIALFPFETASMCDGGWTCSSYMHVGQHGGADPRLMNRTKPATPAQYADLKAELESEPYNYRFKVMKRFPRTATKSRREQIREINRRAA